MLNKIKKKFKRYSSFLGISLSCLTSQINAFAVTITPGVTVDYFDKYTGDNIAGLILGTVFWVLRVSGVILLMYGIYGYVTAKKDGEANNINGAIVKIVFALIFLTMPWIFKSLGIITS